MGTSELRVLLLAGAVVLGGCATTGATFRSGVGDEDLEGPPYIAGRVLPAEGVRLGHLPVAYQRGGSQPALFDPRAEPGSPVAELLREMNSYLDSLAQATNLGVRLAGPSVEAASRATAPDVQFGCVAPGGLAEDRCVESGGALGRGRETMRLAVGRPSPEWTSSIAEALRGAGVTHTLVLTLEVGQYRVRQEGIRGDKRVVLGTNHVASLPWLTSLETPVSVLQLTGAVMDSAGLAVRIGAEGIRAQRTRLLVSAIGAQEVIGEGAVAEVRSQRRDDLPGSPLAWQVALRTLVAELAGRPEVGR